MAKPNYQFEKRKKDLAKKKKREEKLQRKANKPDAPKDGDVDALPAQEGGEPTPTPTE